MRRDGRQPSGERALKPSTVCRCFVRREHDLDRQREQRPQSFDDLLAGHAPLARPRFTSPVYPGGSD
jgi:hypothetical protein